MFKCLFTHAQLWNLTPLMLILKAVMCLLYCLLGMARVSVMQVSVFIFYELLGRPPGTTIVLVVSPLVEVMKDQVMPMK